MASNGDDAPLVKLVRVKRGVYNPYQPSFRQRDVDNQLGKLHDEQRVTTLPRGTDDYPQGIAYQFLPPCTHVRGYSVLPVYKSECMVSKDGPDLSFLEHCKWADFRRRVPMVDKRITGLASMRQNKVMNFCAREVAPEIGESWRRQLPASHQVNIDDEFINELFPHLAKHVCPCLEPLKPLPGTDNLCTELSKPTPTTDDTESPTQPEEGIEIETSHTEPHKPVSRRESSCTEHDKTSKCQDSVCAGRQQRLSPESQSQNNGAVPCPRMSRESQ